MTSRSYSQAMLATVPGRSAAPMIAARPPGAMSDGERVIWRRLIGSLPSMSKATYVSQITACTGTQRQASQHTECVFYSIPTEMAAAREIHRVCAKLVLARSKPKLLVTGLINRGLIDMLEVCACGQELPPDWRALVVEVVLD